MAGGDQPEPGPLPRAHLPVGVPAADAHARPTGESTCRTGQTCHPRTVPREPCSSGRARFVSPPRRQSVCGAISQTCFICCGSSVTWHRARRATKSCNPCWRFCSDIVSMRYLDDRRLEFGLEFQGLMLDIWRVKFLTHERFREIILSTRGLRLEHFLNDGGSSSIPIPVYVAYLNRVRDEAARN